MIAETDGAFTLLAGERRLRAMKSLGYRQVKSEHGVLSPMNRSLISKSVKTKSAKISQRQNVLNTHVGLKKSRALRRGRDKQRQRAVLIRSLRRNLRKLIMVKFQKLLLQKSVLDRKILTAKKNT